MAIPWLTALKIVPWEKVLEHAPGVLEKARGFMDKRRTDGAQAPTDLAQNGKDATGNGAIAVPIGRTNLALIAAVKRLQVRTKWLSAGLLLTLCACAVLAASTVQ
jgi:hypothetical protein